MVKGIFKYLFVILITNFSISAQGLGSKWLEVVRTDSQTIYIDTTNIKHVGNQITIVDQTVFKTPLFLPAYNKEAKSYKSQILFNITSKRFSVLGTLYYDENQRIVGESSLTDYSLGSETFAIPIDSNITMTALYLKSIELTSVDTTEYKNTISKDEKIKALIDSTGLPEQQNIPIVNRDQFIDKDELNNQNRSQTNIETIKPPVTTPVKPTVNSQQQTTYDLSSERIVRSTIFTDGSKYCFQTSSWRDKNKAENQVTRLKREGHNAFIVETYLPNKGGTWYRVRIGYFNSLQETENYMKGMNR